MKHIEKKHRIGLLVPSSNSTQEPEFVQMLPESVSLHVARLSLSRIDADSTVSIVAELEKESRKLADAAVDVVVLAATAPSTRMGKATTRSSSGAWRKPRQGRRLPRRRRCSMRLLRSACSAWRWPQPGAR